MRRFVHTSRIAGTLVLLIALLVTLPGPVTAQTGSSQLLAGGQTVGWSDPWTLDPALTTSGDGFDLLALETAEAVVGVGSFAYVISGSEVRDLLIDSFASELELQPVDRGDYDNVSYSLDIATEGGFAFGIFTLVVESSNGTLFTLILTPVQSFQDDMESAQSAITIDDDSIFDGVDAAVMESLLVEANQGLPETEETEPANGVTVPTPSAESESPVPPTAAAEQGSGLVRDINENLGEGTQSQIPVRETPVSTSQAPLSNSYEVPTSGNVVSYSDDWLVLDTGDDSFQLSAVEVEAYFNVLDLPDNLPEATDPLSFANSLAQTPEFASSTVVEAQELDNGNRWLLVFSEPSGTGLLYFIYEITGSDTGSTTVSLTVEQQDLNSSVDLVVDTVQVNGQPVFDDLREQVPELFEDQLP